MNTATILLRLKATSGYEAESVHHGITPGQYGEVIKALHNPAPMGRPKEEVEHEARRHFELALVFGIDGVLSAPGMLQCEIDGEYVHADVQHAWQGYLSAAAYSNALLQRFDKERYVTNGMRTELRELLEAPEMGDETADRLFKAVLTVAAGMPR